MRLSAALASLLAVATAVSAVDIPVTVGGNGTLTFSPTNVTAAVGDVIVFTFAAKNHSATQSTFTDPCAKASASAIDSGFQFVSSTSSLPTFSVTVNDTSPLWIYCAQTNPASHCHLGMVFAANAPANKTFAQFQAAAESGASSSSNSTSNSTSSSTASSTAPTSSTKSAALGRTANVAALLSLVGLVAGLTL
ncbi:hypothetical protein F5887DRAFT_1069539 [Amanita rubescens]|nr:hypothetical protein F5887DRAFT_1069539 [Amanita rubescens]